MLIPREHGVYGQLGFPIAAAIGAGHVSLSALALTAGFVAAFLAHESLLVLLGARGTRARREQRGGAVRDAAWLSAVAVGGISIGAALDSSGHRSVIAVPSVDRAAVCPPSSSRRLGTGHGQHTSLSLAHHAAEDMSRCDGSFR